jgi:hypothetical protein
MSHAALRDCPFCDERITVDATKCPYCAEPLETIGSDQSLRVSRDTSSHRRIPVIVASTVAILALTSAVVAGTAYARAQNALDVARSDLRTERTEHTQLVDDLRESLSTTRRELERTRGRALFLRFELSTCRAANEIAIDLTEAFVDLVNEAATNDAVGYQIQRAEVLRIDQRWRAKSNQCSDSLFGA